MKESSLPFPFSPISISTCFCTPMRLVPFALGGIAYTLATPAFDTSPSQWTRRLALSCRAAWMFGEAARRGVVSCAGHLARYMRHV